MQLSLSKKDVAQLHIMLSTLPIPPLPVSLTLETSRMQEGDIKTSFNMATVQIAKDATTGDKIVNTHSIVASMSFFAIWNVDKNTDESRRSIMHAKEAVVLALIKRIICYSEKCRDDNVACTDEGVSKIFFDTTVSWIACNMPEDADLSMTSNLDFSAITYEHPLHIAMAHYCYSQGVLYSNKSSKVMCPVHQELESRYSELKTGEEPGMVKQEHLEIAEMYSEFSYSKLLNLCYNRLLTDSLYGHNYAQSDNVYENAKLLLDLSVVNYNKVVSGEQKQSCVEIEQDLSQPATSAKSPIGQERIEKSGLDICLDVANLPTVPNYDNVDSTCPSVVVPASGQGHNTPTTSSMHIDALPSSDFAEPAVAVAPEPAVAVVPEPAVAIAAEPAVAIAPEPAVAIAAEPAVAVAPEPAVAIAPEPAVAIAPEPAVAIAPEPAVVVEIADVAAALAEFDAGAGDAGEDEMVQFVTRTVCASVIQPVNVTHSLTVVKREECDDNSSTETNCSANTGYQDTNFMQLASYKSAAGIFMMELISFMKNDSVYSFENMKTNLRHLLELLQAEDVIAHEACEVIDFAKMISLVTRYIAKNSSNNKQVELFLIMEDIQECLSKKIELDT